MDAKNGIYQVANKRTGRKHAAFANMPYLMMHLPKSCMSQVTELGSCKLSLGCVWGSEVMVGAADLGEEAERLPCEARLMTRATASRCSSGSCSISLSTSPCTHHSLISTHSHALLNPLLFEHFSTLTTHPSVPRQLGRARCCQQYTSAAFKSHSSEEVACCGLSPFRKLF